MNVNEIIENTDLKQLGSLNGENNLATGVFCCDLLSHAMAKLPPNFVWVTVMANTNTLAVATLTEAACVVIAENLQVEQELIEKANEKNIVLLHSNLPIYETAKLVEETLNG